MQSCFYTGRVWHRRKEPISHTFSFRLCMVYLDLDELPEMFRSTWLWSATRPALGRFRRNDHLGDVRTPLAMAVRDLVEERTRRRPEGPIRLLTQLRYAGVLMNPISLYYCFSADGLGVQSVVAEVTNTPWGETHCYVLPGIPTEAGIARRHWSPKVLHVSPFLPMAQEYRWDLTIPGKRLSLRLANYDRGGKSPFEASLHLHRREWTRSNRLNALARHPLQTAQVAAGIYWQALRLWRKGAPFHPHPRSTENSAEMIP